MTTATLLEYLTLPNPELDCTESSTVANAHNARWDPITGLEGWAHFNYEKLMQSYGHVLLEQVPLLLETSPPLTKLARKIITEKTFEGVLETAIMPDIFAALLVAWPLCYSNHEPEDIAEIGRGDLVRRGTTEQMTGIIQTGLVFESMR